jgi:hypothetical protein
MEDELKSSSSSVSQYAGEVEGGDGSSCSRDRHSEIDSDDEWTLDDMGASDNTLPPVSPLEWQAISLINQKTSSSPALLSRPPSPPSFPFLSFPSLPFPPVCPTTYRNRKENFEEPPKKHKTTFPVTPHSNRSRVS